MLREKIGEAADALERARISLDTSRTAQIAEESAIQRRLDALRDEVSRVSRREREGQEAYRAKKSELDDLVRTVQDAAATAVMR